MPRQKSNFSIRKTEDLEDVALLDREIFPLAPRLTTEELEKSEWWVAVHEGIEVGYAGIRLMPEQRKAFLIRAGISVTARGAGLQKQFIRVRVNYARKNGISRCYTYCGTYNLASMRSLFACGFRPYYLSRSEEGEFLYFENTPKIDSN